MKSRRLGAVLISVGLLGLLATTWAASVDPGTWGPGSAWMSSRMAAMHDWMTGSTALREQGSPAIPGAREARITARDLSFSPGEVIVPPRSAVNLVLVNEGALLHDLTIPALAFRLVAAPGTAASGGLSDLAPGSYQFFCSVPGHRDAGMRGVLAVR